MLSITDNKYQSTQSNIFFTKSVKNIGFKKQALLLT